MFYIAGLYKFKKISNIKKNKKILQFFFIKKILEEQLLFLVKVLMELYHQVEKI